MGSLCAWCATVFDGPAIDELIAAFFDAFTSNGGVAPNVDALYGMFLAEAVIVKNIGADPVIYDVPGFIEPRRAILTNGSMAHFREWETSGHTEVFGNIAQRFSRYAKSWMQDGQQQSGGGAKSIHLVRTPAGWKIASLVWDDD